MLSRWQLGYPNALFLANLPACTLLRPIPTRTHAHNGCWQYDTDLVFYNTDMYGSDVPGQAAPWTAEAVAYHGVPTRKNLLTNVIKDQLATYRSRLDGAPVFEADSPSTSEGWAVDFETGGLTGDALDGNACWLVGWLGGAAAGGGDESVVGVYR